ncbi:MAG: hypothetical protein MMC33_002871 [Icmadophila ericetorum]|nr:hypothetical protein [Icmadophila ericetorum]
MGDSQLGLQEAMAYYAGDDPIQGGKVWLDTLFGMGGLMFELLPGYDCPIYASYLDAKYHRDESTSIRKNSICLFEYTSDAPLQRHTSEFYVTVSRNTYFVVRFISTVGNYDYTFDYIFYLDGSIEVKVRASGYISAAYWPDSSTQKVGKRYEYGYRVHDQLATSMHDHVLNFKVDMDINGTANTLMRVGIEPTTKSYKWETGSGPRNSMHLTQQPLTREKGLNWPPNGAEMFILYNTNSTNKWGEPRGYQIRPGTGMGNPIHSTISDTVITEQTAAWSTHDLWALKQHDTEPRSASAWNWIFPSSPLVDFSKFVNDEAILQEDIVLYVNLGGHHIPTTQDIPNTHMHTSSSSFMLIPHNFFDRDPSRKSAQGVKLELESDGNHTVRYYGGHYAINETVVVDSEGGGEAVLEADLKLYSATRNPVRKFPWNQTVGGGGVGFGWV